MADHKQIYQQGADQYQRLISREDHLGNLLPALKRILPLKGLDVVDLGAGTGRLACLLAPTARAVFAFDSSSHMLTITASRLGTLGFNSWIAAAADHRFIPLPLDSADLVISGWSFCYLVVWEKDNWKKSLQEGLREMRRLVRETGVMVIIETLGTGVERPTPPESLRQYFEFLDNNGFHSNWIRTDYQFQDENEARTLVEFFFGREMLPKIGPGPNPILPECTGIWWLTKQELDRNLP